jgi:hypothetical protein
MVLLPVAQRFGRQPYRCAALVHTRISDAETESRAVAAATPAQALSALFPIRRQSRRQTGKRFRT